MVGGSIPPPWTNGESNRDNCYIKSMKPTKTLICKIHGKTPFGKRSDRTERWRCKRCEYEALKRRRKKLKEMLVQEFGGKCIRCGYSKCLRALGFHHRNPEEKKFGFQMKHSTKWNTLLEEAQKCDLLCANCHMEVEDEAVRE